MAQYMYEPLSAQDHSFLVLETPNLHMHVSSTQIFELGPLATDTGGVDFARIKEFIGSILHRIPRYRQKLMMVPFDGTPVWIDDDEFQTNLPLRLFDDGESDAQKGESDPMSERVGIVSLVRRV